MYQGLSDFLKIYTLVSALLVNINNSPSGFFEQVVRSQRFSLNIYSKSLVQYLAMVKDVGLNHATLIL